jgi:hypothetical protein
VPSTSPTRSIYYKLGFSAAPFTMNLLRSR